MTIQDGITVNSNCGYLGFDNDSTGVAKIRGASSTWNCGGSRLEIGYRGSGTLSITDGASVSQHYGSIYGSAWGFIAEFPHAAGVVIVDGLGSTWTNDVVSLGGQGSGTLSITGGGMSATVARLTTLHSWPLM